MSSSRYHINDSKKSTQLDKFASGHQEKNKGDQVPSRICYEELTIGVRIKFQHDYSKF